MSDNYIKIVKTMQSRFGREDIQIEFYVLQRSTTFDNTVTSTNDETAVSTLETRLKRLIIFLRHEVDNEQRVSLVSEGFSLAERGTTQGSSSSKGLIMGKLSQRRISICPTATDLVNCEVTLKAVICICISYQR
ncbi:hypothetical protein NQ318_016387 [Aromia moschata]|uniref:Uncharacterized protein n=1 Tax=Aromia moschata TaxID=1265417 RepID=A0AAV8Z3L0_9CUCU|nr:hypothetical protein NQ318_016387 [Aromia moschata]